MARNGKTLTHVLRDPQTKEVLPLHKQKTLFAEVYEKKTKDTTDLKDLMTVTCCQEDKAADDVSVLCRRVDENVTSDDGTE